MLDRGAFSMQRTTPKERAFMRTKICYKSRLWRCVWEPWMPAQGGRYPVGAHDRPL